MDMIRKIWHRQGLGTVVEIQNDTEVIPRCGTPSNHPSSSLANERLSQLFDSR